MRAIILIIAGAVFGGLESPFFAIIGAILGALIARSTSSPDLPDHRSYGHSPPSVHLLDPLHTHRFSGDNDWQLDSSNDHSDAPLQLDHGATVTYSVRGGEIVANQSPWRHAGTTQTMPNNLKRAKSRISSSPTRRFSGVYGDCCLPGLPNQHIVTVFVTPSAGF